MKRSRTKPARRIIRSWKQARTLLERWRRDCSMVQLELKQPRVIDVVAIDLLRGEPAEPSEEARPRLRGQLIYYTAADVTIRRPSGAILVIDNYEISALSDGKWRVEPP